MISYHNSQVTFFDKIENSKLQEELDKYRPWIGSPVWSAGTEQTGKVAELFLDKGNVWFKVAVEEYA